MGPFKGQQASASNPVMKSTENPQDNPLKQLGEGIPEITLPLFCQITLSQDRNI